MKKLLFLLSILCLLTLTACGGASNAAGPASAPQGGPNASTLPATSRLILGTLKLDGTAQAVTVEQAAELLPLWQTMLVLANSDTAAEQEKEALIAQIQETMTAGQMQAIENMNLTREDMLSIMQGMATGAGAQNNNSQSGSSSNSGGRVFGPGGGVPSDEVRMPGGGGLGPSGGAQNLSADEIATAQASRQANEDFVPPALINAVVEYLQEEAGS